MDKSIMLITHYILMVFAIFFIVSKMLRTEAAKSFVIRCPTVDMDGKIATLKALNKTCSREVSLAVIGMISLSIITSLV